MKKSILFSCFMICTAICTNLFAYSNLSAEVNDVEEEIELKGDLASLGIKSVQKTIRLIQNSTGLEATFFRNLGTIDILIYDDSGNPVYEESVDTSIENQTTIDLSNLSQGQYEIKFINSQNQSMYGDFEI